MAPIPEWYRPSQKTVEGGRGEGTKRTSPISVRIPLTAVVGDGWLPVAVTRRTVDAADKKVEKFTT